MERWPTGSAIRRPHAQVLREMTRWVEITGRPLHEQPALVEDWEQALAPSARQLLGRPAADLATNACLRFQAVLLCAQAGVAIERYRLAHGEWPSDLASLVRAYMPVVPTDPYDGLPPRYLRTADGVVVYSVGPDRSDNQGNLVRNAKPTDGTDVGFQLWDVAKRRQPPGERLCHRID